MNYQQPWQELTIDVAGAVRKDVVLEDLLNNSIYAELPMGVWHFGHTAVDQFLSADWIEYMHDIGIPVRTAMIFYRSPGYLHPDAHVDIMTGSGEPAVSAINWTMDSLDDSEMIWYDIPPIPPVDLVTPAGTIYRDWSLDQIAPYESTRKIIGTTPTLVRTGIPHNVETRTRSRWCVSVRYKSLELTSWENTVDLFEPWIKNVNS